MKNMTFFKTLYTIGAIACGGVFTIIVSTVLCDFLMHSVFQDEIFVEKTGMYYVVWSVSFVSLYAVIIPLVGKLATFALFGKMPINVKPTPDVTNEVKK